MESYQEYGQYLEDLHDQLDRYNQRRVRLLFFNLLITLGIFGGALLGLSGQFPLIIALLLGGIGLIGAIPLAYAWSKHQKEMAALEHEVSRLPYRQLGDKAKRKPVPPLTQTDAIEYIIGDDGELVEIKRQKAGQNE
jgi:hypothetical protein